MHCTEGLGTEQGAAKNKSVTPWWVGGYTVGQRPKNTKVRLLFSIFFLARGRQKQIGGPLVGGWVHSESAAKKYQGQTSFFDIVFLFRIFSHKTLQRAPKR
jgi:hypothetical protein